MKIFPILLLLAGVAVLTINSTIPWWQAAVGGVLCGLAVPLNIGTRVHKRSGQ